MRGAGGARATLGSGRDILVEEEDLAQAQEILKEDNEGFDEEELARLSEEAGRQAEAVPQFPHPAPSDQTGPQTPVENQAPAKTHGLLKAFERLTMDKDETNSPFGR